MGKRNPLEKHHITPQSRCPPGIDKDKDNVVLWSSDFHAAFHKCFQNMTVDETIAFIKTITVPGEYWDGGKLERMRKLIKGEADDG